MILVRVREHDRVDVVEPRPDVVEVGEDQVDPGLVGLGEEHAAVDDEQPAGVLEDRHVAADLAETAERDDAQGAVRQRGRRTEVRMRMAHGSSTPPAARSTRNVASCSSVASTSGSRTGPAGSPSRRNAAFARMTPCVRNMPS